MKIICIKQNKYKRVLLAKKTKQGYLTFAQIKLYREDTFKAASESYEEACRLGDEIEKSYNNFEELISEVYEMRRLQKLYFKTRNRKVLGVAKRQEKKVDELLNNLTNEQ